MLGSLEKNTVAFWRVSYCWNGRKGSGQMTVAQALDTVRRIRDSHPPKRLASLVTTLGVEIINKQADPEPLAKSKKGREETA